MATMPAQFLSCDWGTSSFRLRLVSTATNDTLAEVQAPTGARELYERGQLSGAPRFGLFAEVASEHIRQIGLRHNLKGQPLIISGMASSTIGWKELPYARVPFTLDARGLVVEELRWEAPDGLGPTYIVSGVASQSDMMRGEECQAIGIMAQPEFERFRERCLLILPGTHSKHISIQYGRVNGFQTFMTGELFDVLTNHSVLKATTDRAASIPVYAAEFKAGIACGREDGLAASLFRIRTRVVLERADPAGNTAYLSGILVGAELQNVDRDPTMPIIVAANEQLAAIYSMAIPKDRNAVFVKSIDRATVTAHRLILSRLYDEL
ncbi:MAG TPA: 2-dehydro-3-deoxygalactonokinase [Verrucomicrobiae bacterium]|nr:2-dehydro-3-deoxygalactonokinase [Verrucomicrobiae bacterium]